MFTPPLVIHKTPTQVVADNGIVRLTLDQKTGRYEVKWPNKAEITNAFGQIDATPSTAEAKTHLIRFSRVHDAFGDGVELTERNFTPGKPETRSIFWIYKDRPEVFVRLDVVGAAARSLSPLVTQSLVHLNRKGNVQSLFVPYDNDNYSRYMSDGWGGPKGRKDGSYEVGAIYSSDGPGAIVVGSIDHDTWKSAVRFDPDAAALMATAGVAGDYTHDTQQPPLVTGSVVRSPRFVIGYYSSWKAGLERYGDLNAVVRPPLKWADPVPFGWSSWSPYKDKVNGAEVNTAADFVHDKLPWFRSGGTAYINLDSFWDNMKPPQIEAFVRHVHALGLKAGIYYTPFVGWGKLTDPVRGTSYSYGDITLKDASGAPLPKLDGGYPLDPTHPGEIKRIDLQFDQFLIWGFDYVKLDFMTHAAMEGKHYDPKIQTGTQAYNFGLRHIDDYLSQKRVGRPIFIDLSIAPLFPNGYAHARRVSCDVFSNIGATEYLLNATTYGFWTNHRLYPFNDPDSACVYQPLGEQPVTEAESRSRFTASVITGGLMIAGDDFTKPAPSNRVLSVFSNHELLELARETPAFYTLNSATGSKASDAFTWRDAHYVYIALFNFSKSTESRAIPPSWLPKGARDIRELWTGAHYSAANLTIPLGPYDCAVLKMQAGH